MYAAGIRLSPAAFQPPPAPAEGVPSISVVVPLHEKTLDTLALLHVMAINGPTDEYELIMVLEDAGAPAFPAAVAIAESYPAIARVVSSGPPGAHASPMHDLNAGYEAARGDLIAFVDPNLHMKAELWNAALPYFMKGIKAGSELDLTASLHAFLQKLQYANPCRGFTNEGGRKWDCINGFEPGGKKQCRQCGGLRGITGP